MEIRIEILMGFILISILCGSVSGNEECKPLIEGHNDLNSSRVNIVFIGLMPDIVYENISSIDYLKDLALRTIDYDGTGVGIFSLEPFKSNKNGFNFWYVDRIELANYTNNNENRYSQYRQQVTSFVSSCNLNKKVIISFIGSGDLFLCKATYFSGTYDYVPLNNEEKQQYKQWREKEIETKLIRWKIRKIKLGRLLDKPKLISVLVKLKQMLGLSIDLEDIDKYIIKVVMHEFGHAFGGLNDEYFNPGNEEIVPPENRKFQNCFVGDINACLNSSLNNIWGDIIGRDEVSCFEGCGKFGKGIFRSSENSIMNKQIFDPYSFGLVNEKILCYRIFIETGGIGGYCDQFNITEENIPDYLYGTLS